MKVSLPDLQKEEKELWMGILRWLPGKTGTFNERKYINIMFGKKTGVRKEAFKQSIRN